MSTIKSSAENLTLNADGANNDVIIQSNGSTKVTVDGQNSRVGIGTASPILPLSIKASQEQLTISEGDARGGTFDYRSSTGNLQIATNGANARSAPQLTLNLNGDITANTGDIVFGTAGKGIVLGATTNVDANTLDDYEEGTFTATLTSATAPTSPPTTTALYTKIGRAVTVSLFFEGANTSGGSGAMLITGLPFASGSATGNRGSGTVQSYGITFSGEYMVAEASNSAIYFRGIASNAAWTDLTITAGTTKYLQTTLTYTTA